MPDAHILATPLRITRKPFNSLFEMPPIKVRIEARTRASFNSLFEMRRQRGNREVCTSGSFQFSI